MSVRKSNEIPVRNVPSLPSSYTNLKRKRQHEYDSTSSEVARINNNGDRVSHQREKNHSSVNIKKTNNDGSVGNSKRNSREARNNDDKLAYAMSLIGKDCEVFWVNPADDVEQQNQNPQVPISKINIKGRKNRKKSYKCRSTSPPPPDNNKNKSMPSQDKSGWYDAHVQHYNPVSDTYGIKFAGDDDTEFILSNVTPDMIRPSAKHWINRTHSILSSQGPIYLQDKFIPHTNDSSSLTCKCCSSSNALEENDIDSGCNSTSCSHGNHHKVTKFDDDLFSKDELNAIKLLHDSIQTQIRGYDSLRRIIVLQNVNKNSIGEENTNQGPKAFLSIESGSDEETIINENGDHHMNNAQESALINFHLYTQSDIDALFEILCALFNCCDWFISLTKFIQNNDLVRKTNEKNFFETNSNSKTSHNVDRFTEEEGEQSQEELPSAITTADSTILTNGHHYFNIGYPDTTRDLEIINQFESMLKMGKDCIACLGRIRNRYTISVMAWNNRWYLKKFLQSYNCVWQLLVLLRYRHSEEQENEESSTSELSSKEYKHDSENDSNATFNFDEELQDDDRGVAVLWATLAAG